MKQLFEMMDDLKEQKLAIVKLQSQKDQAWETL